MSITSKDIARLAGVSRSAVSAVLNGHYNKVSVEKRGNDLLAMFAFLTDGTEMDLMALNNYVDSNIKDAICRIPGVSSAEIMAA